MKIFVTFFCCVFLAQTQAQRGSLTPTEVVTVRNELDKTATNGAALETITTYVFGKNRNTAIDVVFNGQLDLFLEGLKTYADNLANEDPTIAPIVPKLKDISTQFQIIFALYRSKGISTTTNAIYFVTQTYYNVMNLYSVWGNQFDSSIPVIAPKSISVPQLYTSAFTTNELSAINNAQSSVKDDVDFILNFFHPADKSTYLASFGNESLSIADTIRGSFEIGILGVNVPEAAAVSIAIFNAMTQAEKITKIYWERVTDLYSTVKQVVLKSYDSVETGNAKFTANPSVSASILAPAQPKPGPNPTRPGAGKIPGKPGKIPNKPGPKLVDIRPLKPGAKPVRPGANPVGSGPVHSPPSAGPTRRHGQ